MQKREVFDVMCVSNFKPKFIVTFLTNGSEKEIACGKTKEQCFRRVISYIKERKIKSYYLVENQISEDVTKIDYGSWGDFFYIRKYHENEKGCECA